jgi:phage terminase large subunit
MKVKLIPAFKDVMQGNQKFVFLYGGRGSGKSYFVADYLIEVSRQESTTILCTREIQKSIQESVYALLKDRIGERGIASEYTILKTEIYHNRTGSRFIFAGLKDHTVDSIKSLQGVKYCWVEEAHSVSDSSLQILIPTLRQEGVKFFFSFNRKKERDPVYSMALNDLTSEEKRQYTIKGVTYKWTQYTGADAIGIYINYDGNPYFPATLEKERVKLLARDHDAYVHVWDGLPEQQGDKAVLSRKQVLDAMTRTVSDEGGYMIGCDVARFGDDRTVIFMRKGLKIVDSLVLKKADTIDVSEAIINMAGEKKPRINIDDTGVGGGVTDNLMHKGYNVNPVNFGSSAIDNDKFANTISEMWFHFKDIIDTIQLPDDTTLMEELTDRYYSFDTKERKKIESKDEYKKRNNKSPDIADAVLLCYYSKSAEPRVHILDF